MITVLKGNKIEITWSIKKCDGSAETISSSAKLYITDAFKVIPLSEGFTVSSGTVSISISGDLLSEGRYSLVLTDGTDKRFINKNTFTITNNPEEVTADCNV